MGAGPWINPDFKFNCFLKVIKIEIYDVGSNIDVDLIFFLTCAEPEEAAFASL